MAVLGIIIGLLLFGLAAVAAAPYYAHLLVNRTREGGPSGFHLFTFLKEGEAKCIIRGERPVRFIMKSSGSRFTRPDGCGPEDSGYWAVRKRESGEPQEDIFADVSEGPIKWWSRWVYGISGAVFTGIYPFQRVYEYPLERTKVVHVEHDGDNADKSHNLNYKVEADWSDHFLIRTFQFPIRIAHADTLDKISVNIVFVILGNIINPFLAAFGIDRWDLRLRNLSTSTINNYTRRTPLKDVLSSATEAEEDAATSGAKPIRGEKSGGFWKAIEAVRQSDEVAGFNMTGVDLLDISANLEADEKKLLHAEALAEPVARAKERNGLADANNVRALHKAVQESGETGITLAEIKAKYEAIMNSKGTVFMNLGGGAGGGDANTALLQEILKELKKGKE